MRPGTCLLSWAYQPGWKLFTYFAAHLGTDESGQIRLLEVPFLVPWVSPCLLLIF